jgi:hypothetical protein
MGIPPFPVASKPALSVPVTIFVITQETFNE